MKIYPLTIPGGSDSYVQYNNGGIFGGDSTFTLNDSTKMVTASGLTLNGTQTYGIDASGGTWTAVMNWNADPDVYSSGTKIIGVDATNFNVFMGAGAFGGRPGGITEAQNEATYNIGMGYRAGYYNDSSSGGTYGDYNVYIGAYSGLGVSSGSSGRYNVGIGALSLRNITSGYSCFGLGYNAASAVTSGRYIVAIGENSCMPITTGVELVAIGPGTFQNASTSTQASVAIGYRAAYGASSGSISNDVYIGREAGYKASGAVACVGIGDRAAYNGAGGDYNTNIGYQSGYTNSTGSSIVTLGCQAGYYNVTSNRLFIDNQSRTNAATEVLQALIYGDFHATPSSQQVTINGDLNVRHHLAGMPDEITATDAGVAASLDTINTEVTTNGDSDLDNVTLANGTSGQIKHIYCVVEGNAGDTWKITPATMVGGTQITFAGAGEGCTMVYADNEGWCVVANNGGTIS